MTNHTLSHSGRRLLDRRGFLVDAAAGLQAVALSALLAEQGLLGAERRIDDNIWRPVIDPSAPLASRPPQFAARAKQVLFLFCSGAWDYKPELIRLHGKPQPGLENAVTFQGPLAELARSPYEFRARGQCGKYTSDLLPKLGELVDEMCFIHSMTAKSNTHGPGENQMNTGYTLEGFPSVGAWVTYALGSETNDLPAFVAIPDPRGNPQSGSDAFGNGFLPAVYQGTSFNSSKPIANLDLPPSISGDTDRATRDFLRRLNDRHLEQWPGDTELAARIASYELAARLQLSAPEAADLSRETAATHALYGTDHANPFLAGFARNCMLARRLLERGVRFVQLFNGAYAMGEGVGNWDGHKQLKSDYDRHGPILDQPAAALLSDLKSRGMLDETLVVWATEFGRTPCFQKGAQGRDHNPKGFTVWLAGTGVKAPFTYGATDEFGYEAVENPSSIYDLHATVLHLLGLDHERLTYFHNGAERRLTDVHGRVIEEILA
jgi:Protein of unknown function (DUF1501)